MADTLTPRIDGLTETHCHLNHSQFNADRDEAIARASNSGIKRLLVIGYDLASSRFALKLANANADIQAVIGIHPEAAKEWDDASAELIEMAQGSRRKVAAWGEIGLDYYWDSIPRDLQQRVFEEQLAAAHNLSLPVVIHCRDAYSDVMDTLERLAFDRAVLHCFTGTRAEAERAIGLGLYIGVGGIATFKKSEELRETLRSLPVERLLLETDSPYLAPLPWRGKRNEPAYITAVAQMLGALLSISPEEVAAQTSRNADMLFDRMQQ